MKTTIRRPSVWLGGLLLVLAACDGGGGGDAGPTETDAGPMGADAGPMSGDAGPMSDDGGASDAGPGACATACASDEACVRGMCVATCGADTAGWEAALAAGLVPLRAFCRVADAFGTLPSGAGRAEVFDVVATATATGTDLVVSAWGASPIDSAPRRELATVSVAHDAGTFLFPGGSVTPSGGGLLFGYTLSDPGVSGEVIHVAADGTVTRYDAPGNFDAATDRPGRFLVNGLGLAGAGTGQGLYALDTGESPARAQRLLLGDLGSYSGAVAVTDQFALAGGLDDAFVSHVYAYGIGALRAALNDGGDASDARREVLRSGAPLGSAFTVVGEEGALTIVVPRYDAAFALEALEALPIAGFTEASGIELGAAYDLTTGSGFSAVYAAATEPMSGRPTVMLRFAGGLLLALLP